MQSKCARRIGLGVVAVTMIAAGNAFAGTASWTPTAPWTVIVTNDVAWTNTAGTTGSDDSRASVTLGAGQASDVIHNSTAASTLGGLIPAGATITGLELHIERNGSGLTGTNTFLIDIDSLPFSVSSVAKSFTLWPGADGTITLGGPTDLWGLTSSEMASVETTTFQVVADGGGGGTFEIDNITGTIHFTNGLPAASKWSLALLVLALLLGAPFVAGGRLRTVFGTAGSRAVSND